MLELTLPDMTCGHCASVVTRTIKDLDPDAKVQISLPDKRVMLETDAAREDIAASLAEAGYPAQ